MEIVEELNKTYKNQFTFHHLNGLKMNKPQTLYSQLYKDITGKPKNAKDSCRALGKIFLKRIFF